MSASGPKLSKSVIMILVITFSFVAGVMAAAGTRILVVKAGYDWMFELAMAFFLLISAVSYARQLVRTDSKQAAGSPPGSTTISTRTSD